MSLASALCRLRSVFAPAPVHSDSRVRRAARSAAEALEGRVLLSGTVYTVTPPVSAAGDVPD